MTLRGSMRFARYGRCSTEDQQNPEVSKEWQWDLAADSVASWGGVLAPGADYFDEAISRSVPWSRRPQASALLRDLRAPDRAFDHIVVAEPQRAFSDAQYSEIIKVFRDCGITLWVPGLGRIDPNNSGQNMMMVLYGCISKSERDQMRYRVRGGQRSKVRHGSASFMGGRDPYGYDTVAIGPHPIPKKAADGKQIKELRVVPAEATVVRRIFDQYLSGDGFKAIAQALADESIPSPSAADPEANQHRNGLTWSYSAVRAILLNPVYTGFLVWGRTRKVEELIDLDNPGLGDRTRQVAVPRDEWTWSPEPKHEAIVARDIWEAVQVQIEANSRGRNGRARRPKSPSRCYLLAGLIRCGLCGKRLEGNNARDRHYYRCRFNQQYAVTKAHPPVNVPENLVVPDLDRWIASVFNEETREATIQMLVASGGIDRTSGEARIGALRTAIKAAQIDLERFKALGDAGADPEVIAGWINDAIVAKRRAEADLVSVQAASPVVTEDSIRAMLDDLGDISEVLADAAPQERKALYQELGIELTFDPTERVIHARQDIAQLSRRWGYQRVGGGT